MQAHEFFIYLIICILFDTDKKSLCNSLLKRHFKPQSEFYFFLSLICNYRVNYRLLNPNELLQRLGEFCMPVTEEWSSLPDHKDSHPPCKIFSAVSVLRTMKTGVAGILQNILGFVVWVTVGLL